MLGENLMHIFCLGTTELQLQNLNSDSQTFDKQVLMRMLQIFKKQAAKINQQSESCSSSSNVYLFLFLLTLFTFAFDSFLNHLILKFSMSFFKNYGLLSNIPFFPPPIYPFSILTAMFRIYIPFTCLTWLGSMPLPMARAIFLLLVGTLKNSKNFSKNFKQSSSVQLTSEPSSLYFILFVFSGWLTISLYALQAFSMSIYGQSECKPTHLSLDSNSQNSLISPIQQLILYSPSQIAFDRICSSSLLRNRLTKSVISSSSLLENCCLAYLFIKSRHGGLVMIDLPMIKTLPIMQQSLEEDRDFISTLFIVAYSENSLISSSI